MVRARVLFTVFAIPLGLVVVFAGGWLFTVVVAFILARAVWEYAGLFAAGGNEPARAFMIISVSLILFARFFYGFSADGLLLTALLMLAMLIHLLAYERGRQTSASDFGATVSGIFYIGLLGSYFVSLRSLPNGQWWLIFSLFAVWLTDTGAYFIGTAFGRHKMAPRLSPHKSWEGYFAGVAFGTLITPLFLFLFQRLGFPPNPAFTIQNIAILGLAISALTVLGDLGESMIKRQMKVKDASQLIPGHGGVFDRIDSWLWALPIGYYLVSLIFLQASN